MARRRHVIVLLLAAGVGALCPPSDARPQLRARVQLHYSSRDRPSAVAREDSESESTAARGATQLRARDDGLESRALPSLALPRAAAPRPSARDASGALVLALCCAIAALSSLDRVMMAVATLPMGAEFAWSDATKSLVAASFTSGYFACLVPAGDARSCALDNVPPAPLQPSEADDLCAKEAGVAPCGCASQRVDGLQWRHRAWK